MASGWPVQNIRMSPLGWPLRAVHRWNHKSWGGQVSLIQAYFFTAFLARGHSKSPKVLKIRTRDQSEKTQARFFGIFYVWENWGRNCELSPWSMQIFARNFYLNPSLDSRISPILRNLSHTCVKPSYALLDQIASSLYRRMRAGVASRDMSRWQWSPEICHNSNRHFEPEDLLPGKNIFLNFRQAKDPTLNVGLMHRKISGPRRQRWSSCRRG